MFIPTPMSRYLLVALVSAAFLLSGGVSTPNAPTSHRTRASLMPAVDTSRTSPIPIKSCRKYKGFRNLQKWGSIDSVHELTCRWIKQKKELGIYPKNALPLDPETLPSYVETSEDSLQFDNMVAYGFEISPPRKPWTVKRSYFLVAEVGDSLYHKNVMGFEPRKDVQTNIRVRGLRPIEVPGASTQYIWFEVATKSSNRNDSSKTESWTGHVFTYDGRRGVRFLSYAPVRSEVYKENGELSGLYQLDVSVPEPGLMKIEERTYKGKIKNRGWVDWIGLHVIDPEVTEKRKYDAMPTTGSYVVIESTKADAWDRESKYVKVVSPSKMDEYTSRE